MTTNNQSLPKKSVVGYGFGDVAYQMISQVQSTLVVYFLYNYTGITGTIIALIIMVAGFWDAANDPMMGALVDRSNFKMGKARPYILFGSIPLAIFLIALFFVPASAALSVKIMWIAVAYIGYGTCRTLVSIPYGTMMVRLTDSREQRLRLARTKSLMGVVGILIVPLSYAVFASGRADEGSRIAAMVVVFAILYIIFNAIVFFTTKEIKRETDGLKLNPFVGIKMVLKNKYWIKLTGISVAYGIQQAITVGLILFYITAKFQSPGMYMPIMALTFVGIIAAALSAKKIENKYGMRKLALFGAVVALVGSLIRIVFLDANIVVYIISFAVAQFGFAYYFLAAAPFVADVVEYGELVKGVRIESITSSSKTFADKIAATVVASGMAYVLDVTGFIDATTAGTSLVNVVQPQSALTGMFIMSAVIPALMAIAMILLLRKFNVREDIDKIKAERAESAK